MATHSSILAWRIPMDRGAWWAIEESDMTEVTQHTELNYQYVEDVSIFCPKLKEPEKLFRKITWGHIKGTTEIHQIAWEQINVKQAALCVCGVAYPLSCVWLFATPWTVAHQAPLSMEFPRQEYWSGLPFPSLGDLPDPGIEPMSLSLLHWQEDSLPQAPPGKPCHNA